jgi:hypothetical protein
VPSGGGANAVREERKAASHLFEPLFVVSLTAGASHIIEARGTLGVRLQNPPGILVLKFSATDDRVLFFNCAIIGGFGGVLYETPSTEMPMLQKVVCH